MPFKPKYTNTCAEIDHRFEPIGAGEDDLIKIFCFEFLAVEIHNGYSQAADVPVIAIAVAIIIGITITG